MTSTMDVFVNMVDTLRPRGHVYVVETILFSKPNIRLDNAPLRCDVTRVVDVTSLARRVWNPAL